MAHCQELCNVQRHITLHPFCQRPVNEPLSVRALYASTLRIGKNRLGRLLANRSEEHTSELQSLRHLVCRLLLEKKKTLEPPNKAAELRSWALTSASARREW